MGMNNQLDFEQLIGQITNTHKALQNSAKLIINRHVTAKAWLTGFYIVEYEQKGSDRAKYGEHLLQDLADRLQGDKAFSYRSLRLYRQFYLVYHSLESPITNYLLSLSSNWQSPIANLQISESQNHTIWQSPIAKSQHDNEADYAPAPQKLFDNLSFTHFAALVSIQDPLQRAFYETMAIRGTWSVRELQRQIDTNYYQRSGWSQNPEKFASRVDAAAEKGSLALDIKSPFVFEFLGLQAKDVVEESELESALIDHLQEFILELGMGFCFEERQKKMLIDNRYFKADLVFYHRILKCHTIMELKAHSLNYADVAQLKLYLAYYRKNIMQPDDNPPIGILLCTEVGNEMAEYTMMDTDQNLFVSKYQLSLPEKERITEFLKKENGGQ